MTLPHIAKTVFLKASPEKVWNFLTDPKMLARWFHPTNRSLTSTGPYHFFKTLEETDERYCWGEVTEVRARERLVYTFAHKWLGDHETRVAWDLVAVDGGTLLKLVHDGFQGGPTDAFEAMCDHDKGWDEHFAALRERVSENVDA
jgi:uncharacterized protein YndB with AHSA1/START domain